MNDTIDFAVDEGVAVLRLEGRACALGRRARAALLEAIDEAEESDGVTAILILVVGEGPVGFALFDEAAGTDEPSLRDLCQRLDYCEIPVGFAFSGALQGAGVELALAAHVRIATDDALVGMSDIGQGGHPVAGVTQRLPRLLGAQDALDLMLGTMVWKASDGRLTALIDHIVDAPLDAAALDICRHLKAPVRVRDSRAGFDDMAAYRTGVETHRRTARTSMANRIIDLVEAAPVVPFEMGEAMEEGAAEAYRETADAQALRHLAVAEAALPRATLAGPDHVAVIGGGVLAVQIVLMLLEAGLRVNWGAADTDRLARAKHALTQLMQQRSEGDSARAREQLGRLVTGTRNAMVQDVQMILLAAPWKPEFTRPEGTVLATVMPGGVDRLGMRFPSPPRGTHLVEILRRSNVTPDEIEGALGLADRLGRHAVIEPSGGACISGRLASALHRAVDGIIDCGADPFGIDLALTRFGLRQGPLMQRDILGLATYAEADRARKQHNWSSELMEIGRHGRESGRGFYQWVGDRAMPDRATRLLMNGARPPEDFGADRIVTLVLGALANEGLRLLREGIARSASDIDVVSVHALHFPRDCGGIMHAVGARGLFAVMKTMERLRSGDTEFWQPLPVWAERVKNGLRFDGM